MKGLLASLFLCQATVKDEKSLKGHFVTIVGRENVPLKGKASGVV